MSFAGMVAQLLGEPVTLGAWAGPVLTHKLSDPKQPDPAPAKTSRPVKRKRGSKAPGRPASVSRQAG